MSVNVVSNSHTFFRRVTTHGGGNMSSVEAAEEDRRAGWDLRWAAPVTAGGAAAEGDSAEPGGQGDPGMEAVAASPSEAESERTPK